MTTTRPSPQLNKQSTVRVDLALFLLACHITKALPVLRLWLIFRALDTAGAGAFPRQGPFKLLHRFGPTMDRSYYNRLLRHGVTLGFWTLEGRNMLRMTGQGPLWGILLDQITPPTGCEFDLIAAIRPFQRTVIVDPSGSVADFAAQCYAAYHGLGQQGERTLSRDFLTTLFNRSIPTLLDWEDRSGMTVQPNLEQTADPETANQWQLDNLDGIHGGPIYTNTQHSVWARQMVNTYIPVPAVIHPHRGRQRKYRKAANHRLHIASVEQSGDGLPALRKMYYTETNAFQRMHRAARHDGRTDRNHIQRKARIGQWRQWGIFEVFDSAGGGQLTNIQRLKLAHSHSRRIKEDKTLTNYPVRAALSLASPVTDPFEDMIDALNAVVTVVSEGPKDSIGVSDPQRSLSRDEMLFRAREIAKGRGLYRYLAMLGRRGRHSRVGSSAYALAEQILFVAGCGGVFPDDPRELRHSVVGLQRARRV